MTGYGQTERQYPNEVWLAILSLIGMVMFVLGLYGSMAGAAGDKNGSKAK